MGWRSAVSASVLSFSLCLISLTQARGAAPDENDVSDPQVRKVLLHKLEDPQVLEKQKLEILDKLDSQYSLLEGEFPEFLKVSSNLGNSVAIRRKASALLRYNYGDVADSVQEKFAKALDAETDSEVLTNYLVAVPTNRPHFEVLVPPLIHLLTNSNEALRNSSINALNVMRYRAESERFIKLINTVYADPKTTKAEKLGLISFFATSSLQVGRTQTLEALKNPDDDFETAAFLAVSTAGLYPADDYDRDALIQISTDRILHSKNQKLREVAIRALDHVYSNLPGSTRTISFDLAEVLLDFAADGNNEVQYCVSRLLSDMERPSERMKDFNDKLEKIFLEKLSVSANAAYLDGTYFAMLPKESLERVEKTFLERYSAEESKPDGKRDLNLLDRIESDLFSIGGDETVKAFSAEIQGELGHERVPSQYVFRKVLESKKDPKVLKEASDQYSDRLFENAVKRDVDYINKFYSSVRYQNELQPLVLRIVDDLADYLVSDKNTYEDRLKLFKEFYDSGMLFENSASPQPISSEGGYRMMAYFLPELAYRNGDLWSEFIKNLANSYPVQNNIGIPRNFQHELDFQSPDMLRAFDSPSGRDLVKAYGEAIVKERAELLKDQTHALGSMDKKVDMDPKVLSSFLDAANALDSGTGWLVQSLIFHRISDKTMDAIVAKMRADHRETELTELLLNRDRLSPASAQFFADCMNANYFPRYRDFFHKLPEWKDSAAILLPVVVVPKNDENYDQVRLKGVHALLKNLKTTDLLDKLSDAERAPIIHSLVDHSDYDAGLAKTFIDSFPTLEDPKFIPNSTQTAIITDKLNYLSQHSNHLDEALWKELKDRIHFIYYDYMISPTVLDPLYQLANSAIQKHPEWSDEISDSKAKKSLRKETDEIFDSLQKALAR